MAARKITNSEISRTLAEISAYLDMRDVAFKPRAYEKAARVIAGLDEEASAIYGRGGVKALKDIPGIGVSIAEKIEELLKTGRLKYYEELQRKTPVKLAELMRIEGLGPKSVKKLYQALKIKTLADLERAVKAHKIAKIPGFGAKTEENILKSIEFVKRTGDRFVLGFTAPQIREIESRLKRLAGADRVVVAGSVRRMKETIGDVDILVTTKGASPKQRAEAAKAIMDYFVRMPEVSRVYAHGDTKSAIKLSSGLDVDLRAVPGESYGAALNYFTGSKDHNVALREIAAKKGWKLNEYGLYRRSAKRAAQIANRKMVAGRTEEEIYEALGMEYIPPELREDKGEIELARERKLPKLIGYDELRGDLQTQTDWTDGSASIEDVAKAALKLGLEYIAITDHTKRLAMTHGLDEKRIQKQWLEIDRVNKRLHASGHKLRVLKGSECDILKDGSLDLPDKILAKCEVVGVAVHSHFNLPQKEQTARIVRAMRNPHADIVFHPTGRIIGRRDAYAVDIAELVRVAKETGTVLEIDAYPDRLDLKDEHVRMAIGAGVKLAINSDAHAPEHLAYLVYGIAQARRGWSTKEDVINAWSLEKMLKMLKQH